MTQRLPKAIICAITILLSLLNPISVFATNEVGGKCGDNLTWTLDSGVLTIRGTGAMDDFQWVLDGSEHIDIPWFSYRNDIQSLVIQRGCTRIGKLAFAGLNISKVELPDSVTEVSQNAFASTPLIEVIIPQSVLSIGMNAFGYYYSSGVPEKINTKLLLTGAPGSAAEDYAEENGFTFKALMAASSFADVAADSWYAMPVQWAVGGGITNGTGEGRFSPVATCTTAQILTFLWRAAGSPEPGGSNPFSDVSSGDYYYKPALWAAKNGLVTGGRLNGSTPCTRAATVTYLWKLSGSPSTGGSSFSDVPAGAAYANAVSWAVAQGITTGTGDKRFSPDATCTRGQIVTFLYRWKNGAAAISRSYTDEELCDMAKAYYKAKSGTMPPKASVDSTKGNTVTIQLYDIVGNRMNTWEWYTVDRATGKGSSMFSGDIDLTKP